MHRIFLLLMTSSALLLLSISCEQQSWHHKLAAELREFTSKYCPRESAPGVRQDSATYAVEQRTITYYYTLSGKLDDPATIALNADLFRRELRRDIINSLEMKQVKDSAIHIAYQYRSATTGDTLLTIRFTEKDYSPSREYEQIKEQPVPRETNPQQRTVVAYTKKIEHTVL